MTWYTSFSADQDHSQVQARYELLGEQSTKCLTLPTLDRIDAWLLGLCIISSTRSEDESAKVGAVLAKTLVLLLNHVDTFSLTFGCTDFRKQLFKSALGSVQD